MAHVSERDKQRHARACERKVRHPNKRAAKYAAKQIANVGGVVGIYKCLHCDGWHVGGLFPRW